VQRWETRLYGGGLGGAKGGGNAGGAHRSINTAYYYATALLIKKKKQPPDALEGKRGKTSGVPGAEAAEQPASPSESLWGSHQPTTQTRPSVAFVEGESYEVKQERGFDVEKLVSNT